MSIKQMGVDELKQMLDSGDDFLLIDCRELDEWRSGHISGAVFMPLSDFRDEMKNLTDKDKQVVVQCRSGRRSMNACQMLEDEGFSKIYNLDGGILEWQEAGFPVVDDE